MTRITNSVQDTEYVYSSSQNNGRIVEMVNHTTGDTVGYSYDTLNRLLTAGSTSGSWGESFTYDGFGNLTDKNVTAGSAPALHITVNAANNRADSLYNYDANGNPWSSARDGSFSASYDALDRIVGVNTYNNGSDSYGYTPDNNRVWKQEPTTLNVGEIHFFGAYGEELGTYPIQTYQTQPNATVQYYLAQTGTNLYFAGRLVYRMNNFITAAQDRLGSFGSYYPYGEEYTTSNQDQVKFATYYRDKTTVLDYARNRYYSSTLGRFMTADPYRATAKGANNPSDPGSWNRYAYVGNDPVNFGDQAGLDGNGCSGGCYYWQVPPASPPSGDQPGDLQPLAPPAQAPAWFNPGAPAAGTGAAQGGPAIHPIYSLHNLPCNKTASQVITDIESNYATFANFVGGFGPVIGIVSFPSGPLTNGATIPISILNDLNLGQIQIWQSLSMSVNVSSLTSTSFTFTTNPGHVLYPASITFSATNSSPGQINFSINVSANFGFPGLGAIWPYSGQLFEDAQWNHFLAQVGADCKK